MTKLFTATSTPKAMATSNNDWKEQRTRRAYYLIAIMTNAGEGDEH